MNEWMNGQPAIFFTTNSLSPIQTARPFHALPQGGHVKAENRAKRSIFPQGNRKDSWPNLDWSIGEDGYDDQGCPFPLIQGGTKTWRGTQCSTGTSRYQQKRTHETRTDDVKGRDLCRSLRIQRPTRSDPETETELTGIWKDSIFF